MTLSRYRLLDKVLKRAIAAAALTAILYASGSFVTAVERHQEIIRQCHADILCDD